MAALAVACAAPVDAFFDKVTVNDPDPAKREVAPQPARAGARRRPPRRRFLPDRRAEMTPHTSTASAAASRTARRATGICSAARAPTSPRWPRSACRCRPASPSRPRCCALYYDEGRAHSATRSRAEVAEGIAHIEQVTGQQVRRRRRSAAGLGPLGRAGVDAGDDGHRPQPRPQRRDGRGPRRRLGRSALRLGQLSPLRPHVRQCRPRPRHDLFEEALEIAKEDKGVHLDTELAAEDWRAARRRATRSWSRRSWAGPSREDPHEQLWGAIGAVFGSWQSDRAKTYRRLNAHPRRLGHRGQRPGDGVRQYGRDLGHRRRLHPRSRRPASALIMANI